KGRNTGGWRAISAVRSASTARSIPRGLRRRRGSARATGRPAPAGEVVLPTDSRSQTTPPQGLLRLHLEGKKRGPRFYGIPSSFFLREAMVFSERCPAGSSSA